VNVWCPGDCIEVLLDLAAEFEYQWEYRNGDTLFRSERASP